MSITISKPTDVGPEWSCLGVPREGWACVCDLDAKSGCPTSVSVFLNASVHACVVPSKDAPQIYKEVRQSLIGLHQIVDDYGVSVGLGCFETDHDEIIIAVFDTKGAFGAQALEETTARLGYESILILDRIEPQKD